MIEGFETRIDKETGVKFEVSYKRGMRTGPAIVTDRNGELYIEQWENDQLVAQVDYKKIFNFR